MGGGTQILSKVKNNLSVPKPENNFVVARSCGEPGDVPHGWVTADCHTFGCRAVVQCGQGFELVGKSERYCQSDGVWAPKELPTCVRKYLI